MIILVPLTSTQAWTTYTFELTQDPYQENVRVGDDVTIRIKRITSLGDDLTEVIDGSFFGGKTELQWTRNGELQPFTPCDQVLPTMTNPVTFTIGSFDENDLITYKVRLVIKNGNDYKSSLISFTVYSEDTPLEPVPGEMPAWVIYTAIGIGVLVILLGIAYFFKKRRA